MNEMENRKEGVQQRCAEKSKMENQFCSIDKEMVRFKAHYFLLYGALGAMLPYIPLIAKNRIGISATSFSVILTAQLFITVLSKTALGYIADYFKRMKIVISVLIIAHCLSFLSILVIPKINEPSSSAQNSMLLNYFEDYENDTELTIVLLSKSTNCPMSAVYHHNLSFNKDKLELPKGENVLSENRSEIICIGQSNMIEKTFCFDVNNNTRFRESFEIQLNYCCSKHFILLELFLPHMKTIENNVFHLYSWYPDMLYENFNTTIPCKATFTDDAKKLNKQPETNNFKTYQFWLYAWLMILSGTCASAAFILSDTICCESVQKYNRDFGRQRIYSALSWGLLAPLGGFLCDVTHNFYSTWILMAVLQSLTIYNLYKMKVVVPQFSQNLAKDVGMAFKSRTFLAFNAGAFINGVSGAAVWYYLIWYMSILGANTFLCGLIPYVQCFAGEIPFMFFSGWIIEKVGHFNIISLSLLCYATRLMWYSYIKNPWLVLPMEITHGITYGVFYPTVASFGKLSAKPGTEATTQSILFSTHEGLGAGIGCVLAGIGFDHFGGPETFFYFSLFSFGFTLLNICSTFFLGKCFFDGSDTSLSTKL